MKIFYHVDNDGKCAAACVKRYYEMNTVHNIDEIECLPINYGWDFPFGEIKQNELVYIVDFSIEPSDMTKLLEITENVIWIDHHISAIRKYDNYEKPIKGLRVDGIAGCMLTYCYMFEMDNGEKPFEKDYVKKAPDFIKYIADRDVWTFEYGDKTKHFCLGLDTKETNPEDPIWNVLFNDIESLNVITNKLISTGKIIKEYKDKYYEGYAKQKGFDTELDGHRAYAINIASGFADSSIFDSIDKSKYELFIIFSTSGSGWRYTVYSDTLDASVIASNHGGGGHKGAAGFRSESLLLKKISEDDVSDGAIVVCGYPGIGKTVATINLQNLGYQVLDVDYKNFSTKNCMFRSQMGNVPMNCEMKNPSFPDNFIRYIRERKNTVDFIFVSSDEDVRNALKLAEIKYVSVYPKKESKYKYINRLSRSNYREEDIAMLNRRWDAEIDELEKEDTTKFALDADMYMSNILNRL